MSNTIQKKEKGISQHNSTLRRFSNTLSNAKDALRKKKSPTVLFRSVNIVISFFYFFIHKLGTPAFVEFPEGEMAGRGATAYK